MNRGTIKGGGVTRVGSHNLIMAYAHIGHDCVIGDRVTLINGAQLAGHIHVEDYATIGSFCLLHQFSRVGRHSYIGADTVITQDVPPFSMVVSSRETRCFGINTVGLERQGFSPERIQDHRAGLPLPAALEAQHHAGRRKNAWNPGPLRGRLNIDPLYRVGHRPRLDQIEHEHEPNRRCCPRNRT